MDIQRRFSNNELPAINAILTAAGIPQSALQHHDFILQGADPIIRSPHKLGEACATTIGASALIAAAIHELNTGLSNTASLTIQDALHHLHDSHYMWQNGYKIGVGAESVALNNFFTCRDGRAIHTMAGPPYMKLLDGYLDFYNCGNNRESISRAVSEYNSWALEEALSNAGLPACVARTQQEWLEHPIGHLLNQRPPVTVDKIQSGSVPVQPVSARAALTGLKVLDFTHVLAGPLCAQNLAMLDADVVHVTSPYHRDTNAQSMAGNFGKKNAYLDLNQSEDQTTMRNLLAETDVFINSYRPGVTDRFGINLEEALKLNSQGIIYVDVSCYGAGHTWSDRPGFETIGQACTGFSVREGGGNVETPAFSPVFYLTDPLTSYMALTGTLAAIYRRATEGGSYHVQVSLAKTGMWVQDLGTLAPNEYLKLANADTYPYKTQQVQTPFGQITKLEDPFQFTNMALHHKKMFSPFGRDAARFG